MSFTNFAALTSEQLTVWSRDFWQAARNNMFLNRFMGSDQNAMIQRITELKRTEKGARAVITLIAELEGDGVAGDRALEGNEEAIQSRDTVINIDQLRHANRSEGRMADQKSVVMFRETSRDVLAYWLADRLDQMAFLMLSGKAFSLTNKGATRVGSDLVNLEFATVPALTNNRHYIWDATNYLGSLADSRAESDLTTSDIITYRTLIEAKAAAKDNYIRPLRGGEGQELYNVFMTPHTLGKLKMDSEFREALKHAAPRSSDNPLFKGAASYYIDGLAIYEYRHVFNTRNASSGSKMGSGGTVDGERVLLCGAQAMGFADIGDPYWVEKEFDYDNQPGISVGKMVGMLRPQFISQVTGTTEDFGSMVISVAH